MIDDTPIKNSKSDRLGFEKIARNLASAFLNNDLSKGFVVGVEGSWGSGKSSLVNLALEELADHSDGPEVIRFAPWLVGSRNELLGELFAVIEPVVLSSVPEAERTNTKNILERYAETSSGLAMLADLAGAGGMPGANLLASFLKSSGKKARELSEYSLSDLNQGLRAKLRLLDRPIVIFIDDLDRLEPAEVGEVLRLVKSVADFPNVAYILAYDPDVVANSLQHSLGVSDGRSYLEKVVQASFKIPNAMNFDLRNWLREEVSELLMVDELEESARDRLEGVYHSWCREYLETPRDVVRVINALKLNFSPVRGKVDPGDMVFLQIVRTKNRNLFNWIERYVSSLSAIADWGAIEPGASERFGKELAAIIDKEGDEQIQFIHDLYDHLPGLDMTTFDAHKNEISVFSVDRSDLLGLESEKRLASPSHYSYYFSFSAPTGTVEDEEVERFLVECANSPDQALLRFRKMIKAKRPQGGCLAEVLLDRITARGRRVSPDQVKGLFQVLAEAVDELIPFARTDFGYAQFLRGTRNEVFGLIESVPDDNAKRDILQRLFSTAKSLSWLVGIISEMALEQGEYLNKEKPKEEQLLSDTDYDLIKKLFLRRVAETPPAELLQTPYFLRLIRTWNELGNSAEVLSWIGKQTATNDGYLNVLGKLQNWTNSSSEGIKYVLRPDILETFLGGVSKVELRLQNIVEDESAEEELRRKASSMLSKIDRR